MGRCKTNVPEGQGDATRAQWVLLGRPAPPGRQQAGKGGGGVLGKETGLRGDTPFLGSKQAGPGGPTWKTDQ